MHTHANVSVLTLQDLLLSLRIQRLHLAESIRDVDAALNNNVGGTLDERIEGCTTKIRLAVTVDHQHTHHLALRVEGVLGKAAPDAGNAVQVHAS